MAPTQLSLLVSPCGEYGVHRLVERPGQIHNACGNIHLALLKTLIGLEKMRRSFTES
jgi:hypothetical protein